MIKFEEAFNIVTDSAFHTGSEEIPVMESSGRILLSPVRSDTDLPPFDRSAVDGFACRQDDLGKALKVIDSVAAGAEPVRAGGTGKYYGIAADNIISLRQLLESALAENDLVIITGGVSAGDYDFVPAALAETDLKLRFDSVAVQPGRPMKLWTGNRKIVFGLPGRPLSSFVQFELMIKPLMAKMMGATFSLSDNMNMILGADYSRKRADLMTWVPVKTDRNGEVVPVEYQGSDHISSLHEATGLMAVPLGQSWIQKGETVTVRAV